MENGFKNAHGTYVNWKNTFAGDADVPADIAPKLQLCQNKMIIFIYLQQASMRMVDFMQLETVVTIGLLMQYLHAIHTLTASDSIRSMSMCKIMPRTVGRKAQSFE